MHDELTNNSTRVLQTQSLARTSEFDSRRHSHGLHIAKDRRRGIDSGTVNDLEGSLRTDSIRIQMTASERSVHLDKTARQWDVKTGMENEEAQNVCKEEVWAVAVSRDGPWVVTAGGDVDGGVLKAEDQLR